jgi:hypothetical protein
LYAIAKNLRKKMTILDKLVKYATKMGMDEKELLSMTVTEAIEAIEDIQLMWKTLIDSAE